MRGEIKKALAILMFLVLVFSMPGIDVYAEVCIDEREQNSEIETVEESPVQEESDEVAEVQEVLEIYTDRSENSDVVTPQEQDYSFSNGKIQGLTSEYLAGLTEDQKKQLNLVIPGTVKGENVTEIADEAFNLNYGSSAYKDCQFIGLDLSNAVNLIRIGNDAFRDCRGFTGELKLPAGLKKIGTYAFSNCGLTGTLAIPEGTEIIDENSFRNTDSNVTGFSGSLIIPASVNTLGKSAFSGQKNITAVEFSGDNLTAIPDSVFRYCSGLSGAVTIPDSVQSLGGNVFGDTSLKTIYLPKMLDPAKSDFIKSNTFGTYGSSKLTAIVCHKEDYTTVCSLLGSNFKLKAGYTIKVNFQGSEAGEFDPVTRLFNLPYNYAKDDYGVWNTDSTYVFPHVEGKKWGLSAGAVKPVSESDKVTQEKLYLIDAIEDPVITFGPGVDKVYDGEPALLEVTATHPRARKASEAEAGDVVFYYWWYWGTIGSSDPVLKGYDKNIFEVTDVIEPRFGIYSSVYVQAYVVDENNKVSLFYTKKHDFTVYVKQADPVVNPVYDKGINSVSEGFPKISTSEGDTKGTIMWDEGQTFECGEKSYNWTFTPDANESGSSNYKTKQGSAVLYGVNEKVFTIKSDPTEHGHINLSDSLKVLQGSDVVLKFDPDIGYKLEYVKIDGELYKGEIINNSFILNDIQANHTVSAGFSPLSADNMDEIIDRLPDLPDNGNPTEEQVHSILETKLNYESLDETVQNNISEEARNQLCDTIAKLPQVEVEVAGEVTLANQNRLLENMTSEDVQALMQDSGCGYKLKVSVEDGNPNEQEKDAITAQLNGATLGKSLNVSVTKIVTADGGFREEPLTVLKTPVVLMFDIPDEYKEVPEGFTRIYSIIRLHDENGILSADILPDLSADASVIAVESDKYSLYAIAYKDVKQGYNPLVSLSQVADIPKVLEDTVYTGSAVEPEVVLLRKNTTDVLVKGRDYAVTYEENINAGEAAATIRGIGNYTGEYTAVFNILPRDIKTASVTVEKGTYVYSGKSFHPAVIIALDDKVLSANNYTVAYTDNKNAGTAVVTVSGRGNYTGKAAGTFKIAKAAQRLSIQKTRADALKVRNTNAVFYKLGIKGAKTGLKYKISDKRIATVNAAGKVNFKHICGKTIITVTAAESNNYMAASLKVQVCVKPATPLFAVQTGSQSMLVKISKVKDISGYQIAYSTDKNFAVPGTKKKTIATSAALNKTIQKLQRNKRYYVKVRAYKKKGKECIWGNWSVSKKINIK